MGYKVLDDSVYDKSNSKGGGPNIFKRINPLYIHLILIIIVIFALIMFFTSNSDFSLNDNDNSKEIVMVGEIEEFNKTYTGDLTLFSSKYVLTTKTGVFDEGGKDFFIENFTGRIIHENNSIILSGKANEIKFGKNTINNNGEIFNLVSSRKTILNTNFNYLHLKFTEGRIKLGSVLNYELSNSNISLTNFNNSLSYDGTFSFIGMADTLNLLTPEHGLNISYKNE